MNLRRGIVFQSLLGLLLVTGCGVSVREYVRPGTTQSLQNYKRIELRLRSSAHGMSATGGAAFGVAGFSASSGEGQAELALQQLENELLMSGFDVQRSSSAPAIGEFSIGEIRRDPMVGWIADRALLTIRDADTGEVVASFTAEDNGVTQTTTALVEALASSVRNRLQ